MSDIRKKERDGGEKKEIHKRERKARERKGSRSWMRSDSGLPT